MDLENLDTVSAVFTALGENPGVEALTGSKASTISMWRAAERFPTNTYLILQEALRAAGKAAPASLWGMKSVTKEQFDDLNMRSA
jgi:hypothetical protein